MLKDELQDIRTLLSEHWINWKNDNNYTMDDDDTPSRDMCRFTSVFLYRWLIENYPEEDWKIRGGIADRRLVKNPDPAFTHEPYGGYQCHGIWFGHFWVEGDKNIIDLTADQFDGDEIIITDLNDPRYKCNMADCELLDAMIFGSEDAHEWFNEWKSSQGLKP